MLVSTVENLTVTTPLGNALIIPIKGYLQMLFLKWEYCLLPAPNVRPVTVLENIVTSRGTSPIKG